MTTKVCSNKPFGNNVNQMFKLNFSEGFKEMKTLKIMGERGSKLLFKSNLGHPTNLFFKLYLWHVLYWNALPSLIYICKYIKTRLFWSKTQTCVLCRFTFPSFDWKQTCTKSNCWFHCFKSSINYSARQRKHFFN